jgi:hypothetical protein
MDRALYSIEETRARLGGISRNSLYSMLRSGALPSVVIGCRRFVSAESIAELIRNATTSVSPSRHAVRSRRSLGDRGGGEILPSAARVSGAREPDAEYRSGAAQVSRSKSARCSRCCCSSASASCVGAVSGRSWSDGRIAKCPRSAATNVDAEWATRP